MKEIYVVSFIRKGKDHVVNVCAFKNRKDAQNYVDQWNEWERSEEGRGDLWFWTNVEYYETRVEI